MSYLPKVYIIILHSKSISCLIDCLSSLDKITYKNCAIIVVNNGSNDLTDINKHIKRKIQLIKTPSNLGFARGNNLGIKEALRNRADYVLLLNDDTIVTPDFLSTLVAAGENHPDVGMLGPKIYYYDEPQKIWFAGARFDERTGVIFALHSDKIGKSRKDNKPEDSDYITGCALLVKKKLIDIVGLLDERFFLYWEDVDWGLRAQKAGFTNLIVPNAHIWHKVSVSTGGMDSPLRAYHKTRSHLLMAKLHAPCTLNRLHWGFSRDIAWLLFKSTDLERVKKARAYISAIKDYHLGRTHKGPLWLWQH
jgi:GT2 family glycosyltransferase